MIRMLFRSISLVGLLLTVGALSARADSFVGNLRANANFTSCGPSCTLTAADDDGTWAQFAAVSETFHVNALSSVTAVTFSYDGGINGNGASIAAGGFQPYLSLFDSAGNFLASTFGIAGSDVTLDAGNLAAGDYQIAISAYFNMSYAENLGVGTLADGFTGLGNLFFGEDLHYAFDVNLKSAATPVPEPGTVCLVVPAALAVFLGKRKRAECIRDDRDNFKGERE